MPILFALTLGLGAFLLFSVEPMIAKMVLPLLGGSPAVWTTCMLFFQVTLLAGYAYAHGSAAWLGGRRQRVVQAVLVILPLAVLPMASFEALEAAAPREGSPTRWLLVALMTSAGLPFFAVSTTAPTLQGWFARTGHRSARDPYFLYGASNLGSMVALIAYPFVIEPLFTMTQQRRLWSLGYGLLAALTLACALVARRSADLDEAESEAGANATGRVELRRWLEWAWLAFVPSSLMLGVTTYLSTDIAPVPLLWVVPLALYLGSFVLVFARKAVVPHATMVRTLPILVMVLAFILGMGLVQPFCIPVHLATFFVAAMVCHGELARRRPDVSRLTSFYLAIAVGGALGGMFNALIAPVVFDRIAEYPLMVILACLALPGAAAGVMSGARRVGDVAFPAVVFALSAAAILDVGGWSNSVMWNLAVVLDSGLVCLACWTHRKRPVRFALTTGAVLLASGLTAGLNGRVLRQERNFFGVLQVTYEPTSNSHRLFHGRTLHGQQSLDPGRRDRPLSYFRREGPIGQVFERYSEHPASPGVAIVGLGAGTLASYARTGQRWTFYEIDPAIARVASDPRYFTFLNDSHAKPVTIVLGDARLRLREAPDRSFGLIVLDAFSADAVPMHLLTREALRLYRSKLAPGGLLAFQITNRYVDLDPVLGTLARDAGFACRVSYDLNLSRQQISSGEQKSIWGVMAGRESDLGPLASDPRWHAPKRDGSAVWKDDFSDLARHLIVRPR